VHNQTRPWLSIVEWHVSLPRAEEQAEFGLCLHKRLSLGCRRAAGLASSVLLVAFGGARMWLRFLPTREQVFARMYAGFDGLAIGCQAATKSACRGERHKKALNSAPVSAKHGMGCCVFWRGRSSSQRSRDSGSSGPQPAVFRCHCPMGLSGRGWLFQTASRITNLPYPPRPTLMPLVNVPNNGESMLTRRWYLVVGRGGWRGSSLAFPPASRQTQNL
jgi:hypothetical protein